jgi:hypothetical protein
MSAWTRGDLELSEADLPMSAWTRGDLALSEVDLPNLRRLRFVIVTD